MASHLDLRTKYNRARWILLLKLWHHPRGLRAGKLILWNIGESIKTIFQAEIDAACELVDFLKLNIVYMIEIYQEQPITVGEVSNKLEYRPLEGFVYAITPFNFTAIGGNLCASAALMGNVVLWKPSDHQVYSAKVIMDVLMKPVFLKA